jgi:hypothetical protein
MTVRTWITLSVAVLIALSVAIVVQFLRPVPPPAIVVRAGDARLTGVLDEACWPQRSGKLRCTHGNPEDAPAQTIDDNGSFRIVFAYPAEPKEGSITVRTPDGKDVIDADWKRTLHYDLDPGRYVLTTQAGKSGESFVRYVFALRVTRSGS